MGKSSKRKGSKRTAKATTAEPRAKRSTNGGTPASAEAIKQEILAKVAEATNKRRSNPDLLTTSIIPAEEDGEDDGILAEIKECMDWFRQDGVLDEMHTAYKDAYAEEVDEEGWYHGYRRITTGRLEIKVKGVFMEEKFPELGDKLVAYAVKQARKDERVRGMMDAGGQHFLFDHWSIIITNVTVKAQSFHIDVDSNNLQVGLVLCDGIPGTIVLVKEKTGPYTVEDLLRTPAWYDAPAPLRNLLLSQDVKKVVHRILDAYGPLLRPFGDLKWNMARAEEICFNHDDDEDDDTEDDDDDRKKKELRCGDLICTSGGIPHAGPASSGFRAVMFGAASPTKEHLYKSETQYFAHSAMLFMIQAVWDRTPDTESREWLLQKLAQRVFEYDSALIDNHEGTSIAFTQFMKEVTETTATRIIARKFLKNHGSKTASELFQWGPFTEEEEDNE